MIRSFRTKIACVVVLMAVCAACQRGSHQTAGAPLPQPNETPSYTVGADYNQSPASSK